MPVYRVQAPNGKIYKVEGPENADPNTLFSFVQQQLETDDARRLQKEYGPGVMGTFGRAVKRGAGQLGSTVTDIIPAAIGSALGFEEYAKEQLKEAEDKRAAREAESPTLFRSYKEVEGIGDVPRFVAETIGEQVPNIATSLIPGVGFGVAAGRTAATGAAKALTAQAAQRGLAGEAAEQFIAKGLQAAAPQIAQSAARGQIAGVALGSYAQNAPEVFENIYENTGELAPGAAALFSIGSAALDSILPATLARQLTGPVKMGIVEKVLEKSGMDKGLLRSVTASMLGAAPTEGLTEGAQEAISIAAERFVGKNPQIFGSKEWDRIMESAVRGAVAGGAFGAAGGVPEGIRARYQDQIDAAAQQAQQTGQSVPLQIGYDSKVGSGLPATIYVHPDGSTSFVSELSEAAFKEKYPEIKFDPGLTPEQRAKEDKAAAIRARQEAQRQATQLKEDQAALKKALSELTETPKDLLSLAQGPGPLAQTVAQAQAEAETLTKKARPITTSTEAPEVPSAPSLGSITKIDDPKAFGKLFGIGPTAAILRPDGPLAGKDLSNPADAADIKRVLEAYASGKPAAGAAEKIDTFLKRPEFQGAADVARPVEPPSGAGVGVPSKPVAGAAPSAVEPVEPDGVVPTGAVVEQPAGREGQQPVAVEAAREEAAGVPVETATAPAVEAPALAPAVEAVEPELGKKAKTDLAKAEKGAEEAAKEQANFINEIDQNIDDLLTSRLREAGRSAGLKDSDLPSQDFRGSEVHNFLRLPMLFAQYRDSEEMLRQSVGTPQEAKNRQQMAQIEEAINAAGPDAVQIFNQLRRMPAQRQVQSLSELNRLGLQQFDAMAKDIAAKTKAEMAEQAAPKDQKQTNELFPGTDRWSQALNYVNDVVLQTPEQREAFKKAINTKGPLHAINSVYTKLDANGQAQLKKFLTEELGLPLYLPKYEGPAFNEADAALAQKGDFNGLLRSMLNQIQNPAIKQVLRKLRSLNLGVRLVVGPVEGGRAGSYDPATRTITLDPQNGLNAHTFIHESIHAAISNVLAAPSHPLTKAFEKFFVQIQDRLGPAYGAQDLQEFAAELVGNPSFQAVLKSIKTPRSENMFMRVLRNIAEFFGFAPKTSAFDTGLKFVSDALDLTGGVEATAAQKMFLGMGNFPAVGAVGNAMPSLTGRTIDATKNYLSNLQGRDLKTLAFGLLRLDNINQMYGKELPSIQKLLDALEKRNGTQERAINAINENYKKFRKIEKQHRAQMQRMSNLAIEARLKEVDLSKPHITKQLPQETWDRMSATAKQDFLANEARREADYNHLKSQFNALHPDVQGVYRTIRGEYDGAFKRYMKILDDAANSVSPSLAAELKQRFESMKPLIGYVPFLRSGDFWVEFTDPATNEPAVHAFESLRERQQFIDGQLKNIPYRTYQNVQDVRFTGEGLPPSSFILKVMNGMRQNGASQAQLDGVYQAYLSTFPAESIMKQFMKSKDRAGMERDLINGYGDVMVRWARKLANSEYVPQIDKALYQIGQEAGAQSDPTVYAAAQNIMDQAAFFHNPNFGTLVSTATTLSYVEFILGNISSALVNITSLPMLVYPMLTGKFGWGDTTTAMTAAGKTAMNDWSRNTKYKNLYEALMDHGQLEHTMAREVLEGRRQKTSDYLGIKARIMDGLSIPFAAAEKYNRGVTAIAAYDLARNSGMNEQEAIRYALDTVKNAHTSGMAATGPKWMQTPLGRMFFTFKSFVWNSAYVMARAFHQAFKGESTKIRKAAQRQLLATYGMATVFTGIKGMPFYGAISVMAQMLNALFGDDEEPFDFDEFLRDIFGEFLYKGAFNYATNLEIANRSGIATDLLFRDDPRGVAEHGYVLSAMQQIFGPIGSIAVNSGRAVELFKDGEIVRAVETAAPSFVRNFSKGLRYMVDGATTLKGDPIMEDISVYNSVMQMVGFSPADLSSRYERIQAAKGFEREVLQRRNKALQLYTMARTAGDMEAMEQARERIAAFNDANPAYRITRDSIQRSIRARESAEKEMIYGVRFNKKLTPEIMERFLDEED